MKKGEKKYLMEPWATQWVSFWSLGSESTLLPVQRSLRELAKSKGA